MINSNNIITGEKIQKLCDLYIGYEEDFNFNPNIKNDITKHLNLNSVNNIINNPHILFCYTHRIYDFSNKIHFFNNPFILITHNSDFNIIFNEKINNILSSEKLIKWYSQNICVENEKLKILPIGFANSMWLHGNLKLFNDLEFITNYTKTKNIYFNFDINTNYNKRIICFNTLKNKLQWLGSVDHENNLKRLKDYKFSICPEGNGIDTHRLWESLYLKVVPIVIENQFIKLLKKYNVPLVILNNWNELDEDKLNYNDYNFNDEKFIEILDFCKKKKQINK